MEEDSEGWYKALDLLRSPEYAVPLMINMTGSVCFLLIGEAGDLGICPHLGGTKNFQ